MISHDHDLRALARGLVIGLPVALLLDSLLVGLVWIVVTR